MALIFHERLGLDGRRISPFSWRIRYALAHKGLDPEVVPTRFADVERIRALSGQHLVPIIEHDGRVVHDSWSIACHLEDRFPDRAIAVRRPRRPRRRPAGEHLVRHGARTRRCARRSVPTSSGASILATAPISAVRARKQFGMTLEQYCADRGCRAARSVEGVRAAGAHLSEQPFLAGDAPAYVDYIIFSVFQQARIGSPRDVLRLAPEPGATRAWRGRMVALHGGLGDRFAGYPTEDT